MEAEDARRGGFLKTGDDRLNSETLGLCGGGGVFWGHEMDRGDKAGRAGE